MTTHPGIFRDPPGKFGFRPFRAFGRERAVALAALAVFCHAALGKPMAGDQPPNQEARPDLGLSTLADFPKDITGGLGLLLNQGFTVNPGLGNLARPSLGALSARNIVGRILDHRMEIPGCLATLQLPEVFSVINWIKLSPDHRSTLLFGFGEPNGDYLVAATDSSGAPMLAFLNQEKVSQLDRAKIAATNLADGHLHAVVAVVDLGSGLVRLYVDGRPEAASTISLWRPHQLGFAFACYSLQGQTSVHGLDAVGLLMPRIVLRGLTDDEIAKLKPCEAGPGQEIASIDAALGLQLTRDTLVEFWPPEYTYLLRRRP